MKLFLLSSIRKCSDRYPHWITRLIHTRKLKKSLTDWNPDSGTPAPHVLKQKAVRELADKYALNTLVETGTFMGDMVFAQRHRFSKIYSIELSPKLSLLAKNRFKSYPHITIITGNSGVELHNLVPQLKEPALFFLDGHYSGGVTALGDVVCPVFSELEAILSSTLPHIVLIDDARLFIGADSYPTLEELRKFVLQKDPGKTIKVQNDQIYLLPG